MNLFRSETMQYFKIVIPKANAVKILSAMETVGNIQFVDRSTELNKPLFSETVKRCDELLANIAEIEKKMKENMMSIVSPIKSKYFYQDLQEESRHCKDSDEKVFAEIDSDITRTFLRLQEATSSESNMKETILYLKKKLCFYNQIKEITPEGSLRYSMSLKIVVLYHSLTPKRRA